MRLKMLAGLVGILHRWMRRCGSLSVDDRLLARITLPSLLILAAIFPVFCNAEEACPPDASSFHECNVFREEQLAKV